MQCISKILSHSSDSIIFPQSGSSSNRCAKKHHLKKNNVLAVYILPPAKPTVFSLKDVFVSKFGSSPGFQGVKKKFRCKICEFSGRKTDQPHRSNFGASKRKIPTEFQIPQRDDDVFEDWLNQICKDRTNKQN